MSEPEIKDEAIVFAGDARSFEEIFLLIQEAGGLPVILRPALILGGPSEFHLPKGISFDEVRVNAAMALGMSVAGLVLVEKRVTSRIGRFFYNLCGRLGTITAGNKQAPE